MSEGRELFTQTLRVHGFWLIRSYSSSFWGFGTIFKPLNSRLFDLKRNWFLDIVKILKCIKIHAGTRGYQMVNAGGNIFNNPYPHSHGVMTGYRCTPDSFFSLFHQGIYSVWSDIELQSDTGVRQMVWAAAVYDLPTRAANIQKAVILKDISFAILNHGVFLLDLTWGIRLNPCCSFTVLELIDFRLITPLLISL